MSFRALENEQILMTFDDFGNPQMNIVFWRIKSVNPFNKGVAKILA